MVMNGILDMSQSNSAAMGNHYTFMDFWLLPSAKLTQVTATEAAPTDKNSAENNSLGNGCSWIGL
jgi:hypothetical protein